MKNIWRHLRPFNILQILLGWNPFRNNLYFIEVTLFNVVQPSTFISKLLSNHRGIHYVGSSMNPNANLSYMWKTFDRADCGAMYTNQAMEMTHEIQTNPTHHCKMSLFIWAQALHALDGKRKAILHMPGDVAKYSQWDLTYQEPQFCNKEWLGRVLLSWINIRGQRDLVNTQLLTFIEMHGMVVCIKQWILRRDSVTQDF